MNATVRCPNCQKTFEVGEALLGRKARCQGCSAEFVLVAESPAATPVADFERQNSGIPLSNRTLKPHKASFILLGNPLIVVFAVLAVAGFLANPLAWAVFAVLSLVSYAIRNVQYSKESYEFDEDALIYRSGTLFSNAETRVEYRKITQVVAYIGFVQDLVFKTGTLFLKTAGSSAAKVSVRHVDAPLELYDEIRRRMQANGFALKKERLLQHAKPHMLGVLGESSSQAGANVFLVYLAFSSFSQAGGTEEIIAGAAVWGAILAVLAFRFVFAYLDLRKRVYELYEDSIFYSEGFLDQRYSFIPMESVADVENSQGFLSKIFGIHDIKISSEGSNNSIAFHNLVNGLKFMETVKALKQGYHSRAWSENPTEGGTSFNSDGNAVSNRKENALEYDTEFTGTYFASKKRVLVGALPFIVFPPAFLVVALVALIQAAFTRYSIGKNSIERTFDFIQTKHSSFSTDKITKVVFSENLIDRFMGTCGVKFLSIGSSTSITFAGIPKEEGFYERVLAKVGIRMRGEYETVPVEFNAGNFWKANLVPLVISDLLVIAALAIGAFLSVPEAYAVAAGIAVVVGTAFAYAHAFYSKERYEHRVYDSFVRSKRGIFILVEEYAALEHVKSVETNKYPFSEAGTLKLEVSGEETVTYQQKGVAKTVVVPNAVKVEYAADCQGLHDKMDALVEGTEISREILDSRQESLANALVWAIAVSVLPFVGLFVSASSSSFDPVVPGIALMAVSALVIGATVLVVKSKSYAVERSRVSARWGVIVKSRKTVLFSKINVAEQSQGFWNKLFWNGNVAIFTKGSSGKDLSVSNIENHSGFYEKVSSR